MNDLKIGTKILVKEGDSTLTMVFLGWDDPDTKLSAMVAPYELVSADNITLA